MEPLDYPQMKTEVCDWMERTHTMVLSTCAAVENNRQVTARMMSTIHKDGRVYFQTGPTAKFDQLRQNPLVALCQGALPGAGRHGKRPLPLSHDRESGSKDARKTALQGPDEVQVWLSSG